MSKNEYSYSSEKLIFNDHIILTEFYYHFFKNQEFDFVWANGLKKVYDFKDDSGVYTLENALEYMDDDQEKMLAILNYIFSSKCPNAYIDYIFVNYLLNDDGTQNLIKQILIVYQIGESDLVIRVPYYAFTKYALNEFYEQVVQKGEN